MKRISLIIIFAFAAIALVLGGSGQILNAQDPLAPGGDSGLTYYAPFPIDITLDGSADDWEGVPRVVMSDGGDPQISFAASADDEFIYFLGDVTDSTIISGQNGTDYWNEDSVEFYINGTGDLGLRTYIDGVAQITIPALNIDLPSEEAIVSGTRGSTANATVAAEQTDRGYLIEVAVPLQNDVWDIELAHGNAVGFQVHLNGARETSRDTKLIWSLLDSSDQSYQNPSLFGTLIFFEVGSTDIPEPPSAGGEDDAPGLPQVNRSALYFNGRLPTEARVIDLMSRMTLEEKIGQMTLVEVNSVRPGDITNESLGGILSGGGGYPQTGNTPQEWANRVTEIQDEALETRLGIPVIYGVDAVHGHSNLYGATIFPHNIGLGATRNAELIQEVCRITALETVATGIYWNYSPVLAVTQDIRWGRTYEGYGQDTGLVSELATACMLGLQGESLDLPTTMLATPKHYVGDGGAVWGTSTTGDYQIDQGVTDISEMELRTIHLPPYLDAIENGAQSIMISYTSWGGIKMHGQQYLITDVLRNELGYEGFIVSDWQGIDQITDDYYEAVVTAINAGVDMNMVPYDYIGFIETMKAAVNNGDIPLTRIDDAVRRILIAKFDMGLFEDPYPVEELQSSIGSGAHRAVARQAVSESQVLLRNEGDVLPLDVNSDTILVAGRAADNIGMQSGGWTIEWQGGLGETTIGTTILEGIQLAVSEDTTVEYAVDGDFGDMSASVGIVVVGEEPYAEGIGDDPDLELSADDLQTIANMQNHVEQVVVVLVSGRPMIVTDHIENWDAFVAAWLPGTEGQGVADVLFGYQPFTGVLSYSWPASIDQVPMTPRNEDGALFQYGFGLTTEATQASTTVDFTLSDFQAELPEVTTDEFNNNLGFVTFGDTPNVTLSVVPAEGDLALPEQSEGNSVLQVDYDIAAFGGFSYIPSIDDTWVAWDWSDYEGIRFSLYGNNTGAIVQFEVFDNRNPELNSDSAERFFFHITDDYNGWQTFEIPFSEFQRRTDFQPGGALEDGLGLVEVSGIAFSFPAGAGAQTAYIDQIEIYGGAAGIPPRVYVPAASMPPVVEAETPAEGDAPQVEVFVVDEVTLLNDFDFDAVPEVTQDSDGNNLGLVAWGDTPENVTLGVAEVDSQRALEISYDIGVFGGFSWVPGGDGVWEAQDWTSFDGVQFDLYGNNTGAIVQVEIFDNRAEDATTDSAERFFYHITDDYEGWQTFTIPFSAFQRRTDFQPGGAPDDGLGLNEVHGMAFGFPTGTGPQVAYLDNLSLVTGEVELVAAEQTGFVVTEVTLVNDFEFDAVPEITQDSAGNNLGIVPWGDTPGNVTLGVAEVDGQQGLEVSYEILVFGGFSWVPADENGEWLAQDWTSFDGIQFDLYGNNTGGTISIQLFDNRATDTDADSAERFFFLITDDYEGWQTFAIPFSAFQRRTDWQPGGAPDDGLGLNEVHGLAFEFPSGVGAQVAYVDNLSLVTGEGEIAVDAADAPAEEAAPALEPEEMVLVVTAATLVNDFEIDALPEVTQDSDGNNLGLVAWGDTPDNVVLGLAEADGQRALEITYDIGTFGGFSWVPATEDGEWLAQDWTSFNGVQFDLYGNNTGAIVQVEIFDNRAEDATTDSAERFFFHITDDYEGWQTFVVPFSEFQRRTDFQPGGAPDDGLGLNEVHGMAFGFPAGVGPQVAYLDNLNLVVGEEMTATAAAIAAYPFDGEWELVWSDEFDADAGTIPNPDIWTCEVGGWGWGNNERQFYTAEGNAFHNGEGQMVIEAREETVEGSSCWYGTCEYSSARCITKDNAEFLFGRIEMRAQIPTGQGVWPAFWMLGADFPEVMWPDSGEIDIMENVGHETDRVHGTVHGPGYSGAAGRGRSFTIDGNFYEDFYVYAIEWEPDVIRWYVNDELYYTFTPEGLNREYVFNNEFFLLMNLAIGGNWPGLPDETTVFPQTYTVDYIRVYQRQAAE